MTTSVQAIADEYVTALAAGEPQAAQALGHPSPSVLPDFSPAWLEERHALQGRTLEQLSASSASGDDRVLHAALSERLRAERDLFDTGFTMRMIAGLATPVHLVVGRLDGATVGDDEAGDRVLRLLEEAPGAIDGYRHALDRARDLGSKGRFSGTGVAAARQVRHLTDQVAGWIADGHLERVRHGVELSAATSKRADSGIAAAGAALERLHRFLRDDLVTDASVEDAVGPDVYPTMVASMLGTSIDLDATYAYGWEELHRLVAEARTIATDLGGSGGDPVQSVAQVLDNDPRYRLDGIDAITDWLGQRVADTTTALARDAFALPSTITDVECVVSQASRGVVFYMPAPPDGSAPGRIVWTIPSGVPVAATWREVTSLHHEGLPGHHLEHTVTRANPHLHPWQRYLSHVHGYAEGWAHYAEALSDELGLIREPAERLGMILGQIWRSVRVVADIGLHTGRPIPATSLTSAGTWTPTVARDLLVDYALLEPQLAAFEVDRYLGVPGQALAFKVGAKLWTEARAQWRLARGDAFTLAGFHEEALGLGPMGLGPLRDVLLAERNLSAPSWPRNGH